MPTKREVENRSIRNSEDLCKLAEDLGYGGFPHQLQNNNGAYVSSLTNFLNDNPGAIEALVEWALENCDLDEHSDTACPSCGCEEGEGITDGCVDPIGCGRTE